ncbi:MAG: filamentous hemagglutinin N-terminal domain-containing protein, partial [Phycisphaerales bacterium]|nr:filamentous hemagglutinin N-terminal domain-containing protein [Phycisphaerales bacterium]
MTRNVTTPSLLSRIFGRQPLALAAAAAVSVLTVDTAARAQAVDIQNPAVIAGQVSWNASANQWVFTAGHQAIIEYAAFNIYQGGHVEFIQPHANAAVLNRILGADPSTINGSLTANGKLFFVNPAGITFGQNAVVNAGQLYAAAGSISNADFVNGVNRFTNLSGDVANLGTIAGDGVALLGQHVANHGTILAPDGFITLAAADRVVLAPDNSGIIVQIERDQVSGTDQAGIENTGKLAARGGEVRASAGDFYSMAMDIEGTIIGETIELTGGDDGIVRVDGTLRAGSWANNSDVGGKIVVTGEKVWLDSNAWLDARGANGGGEILVGGDYQGNNEDVRNAWRTHISRGARLDASAYIDGDGGKIIIWSDDFTNYFGTLRANSAGSGHRGGFAEISGKRLLGFAGKVSLRGSSRGMSGTLLLDPTDITIDDNATTDGSFDGGDPDTFTGTAATANVDIADLNAALAVANVVITTASAEAGTGNITWNTATGINDGGAGNSITLIADNDIIFTDINFDAWTGDFTAQAVNDITVTSMTFGTWSGAFLAEADNNININGAMNRAGASGDITLIADHDTGGAGVLTISQAINTAGGDLDLEGHQIQISAALDAAAVTGTAAAGGMIITAAGDITGTGNVDLDGGAGGMITSGDITTSAGSITLSAAGGIALAGAVELDTTNAGGSAAG